MRGTRGAVFRGVAAAALLASQAGCALLGGGATPETPEQSVARLAAEPAIGAGRIRAVVKNGDVQLHGAAPGFGALQCAIANAGLVPGVQLVVDMMVLQPGPSRVSCLAPRVFAANGTQ
jgi:hypothetical protein